MTGKKRDGDTEHERRRQAISSLWPSRLRPSRDRTDAGPTAGGGREGGDWPRRAAIGPVDPYLCGLLPDLNCGLLAQPATRGSKGMRPALFDHFVGAGEEGGRDREAEFSCGFQIDHQLDPGREKYGKIDRLFTLEDTACVYSGLAIPLLHTRPIAHKAANNGGCAGLVRGGDADLHGTADEQLAPAVQEGARSDQQGVRRRSSEGCECRVYFGVRVRMKQVDRQAKGDRPRLDIGLETPGRTEIRVDEHGNLFRLGDKLVQEAQPFAGKLARENSHTGGISLGLVQARHDAEANRIVATQEYDRDCLGRSLRRSD